MRNFLILAAAACAAFFCVATHGQVSHTTVFNNLVVRTNLTLGGVSRNTWPSGTGDVLASNDLTNQAPLLGAGGVSIFATNAVGFRSAVGLVIGTDVQAFSSTLSDWANLPTNSISAFLTEAEASALYQATNANLTSWSAVAPSAYVLKAGDTMTGTLTVTGLTNSALTASRFVTSAADKSLASTGTSAALSSTLSDELGTGRAVFESTFSTFSLLDQPAVDVSGTSIDLSSTNRVFGKSITGAVTLEATSEAEGMRWILIATNATGSATLAFSDVDKWTSGSVPVLDLVSGGVNVYSFTRQGGVTIGAVSQGGANSYTVATLPGSATTGAQVYASDVLAPRRTGALVEWDGSVWKEARSWVTSTADIWTYLSNLASEKWEGSNPKSIAIFADRFVTATTVNLDRWGGTASSAGSISAGELSGVSYLSLECGTSASGRAMVMNEQWTPVSGEYISGNVRIRFPTLSDSTDKFWIAFGTSAGSGTSLGTGANGFVYDVWNTTSHNSAMTNNLLMFKRVGSAMTTTDTGITINTNDWITLGYQIKYTDECRLYVNGSCVLTNTSLSPDQQFTAVMRIARTEGTTAGRAVWADWVHISRRFATDRTSF